MASKTEIAWCDSTFNPWIGCTKVSPACDHCYASVSTATRALGVEWGAGQPRRRTSPENRKLPLRWNARAFEECAECGWRGEHHGTHNFCPSCDGEDLKPARRRVFCASLADVFDNDVDPAWRVDLFDLILSTPNLDWLLLTKRIGNAWPMLHEVRDRTRRLDPYSWLNFWLGGKPPPNIWLGATVCNQAEADRDIPKLLATPARVRFLSMEPLLGPVTLRERQFCGDSDPCLGGRPDQCAVGSYFSFPGVDWVIVGGESGHGARPLHPDWARSIRDQCAAAGVPFLFKQWGEWLPAEREFLGDRMAMVADDGGDPERLAGMGRRPCTTLGDQEFWRAGKKAAGRYLDGMLHNGFPEAA